MNKLKFNPRTERYSIDGHELHCGDCFQLLVNGEWKPVRIEHSGERGWFLVGLKIPIHALVDYFARFHS